ncbi:hypothetical protein BABINDRAFT_6107 [Babjeviella inositovora NRRL Y-12698]|uniref:Intradiol ring-cleavage dioxygenases domain-containing protein n=1 Tax=Babjeviella inositovora NRRL Y-12698 TaxID=984486 RepID=A0A1E3R067_9ASCO|nr:uncharacterized protein BABINDRAFT_6107 [Babjeviella inositovora NRRL Y-12698]ODQ83265.1 hypothetical protein BABINDRAFT_6107 [Babjeviella inositovora NRRL Y-12698]
MATEKRALPEPNPNVKILDMSDDTITQNVIAINSQHNDARVRFVLERLVHHLHDFARETRLTTEEWGNAIQFVTECGKICSDIRQEFILLSDVFGLSVLVDGMSHPKPDSATIGTLLGPFHTHDAVEHTSDESLCSEGKGEPLLIQGKLTNTQGQPIANASIDIWECDENGLYDTQYADRDGPDMRGIVRTGEDGSFTIKCTKPVAYPIPHDGPVGKLLAKLNRHPYRPAHIHFIIKAEGYDELITALYHRGDKYETSDAVFGVKSKLLFDLEPLGEERAKKHNMKASDWFLNWDFKIITLGESLALRHNVSRKAVDLFDPKIQLNADGLPIADLD